MNPVELHPIEARSLALHRAVADRLRAEPELWRRAQERLRVWRRDESKHSRNLSAWDLLMDATALDVADAITDAGDRGLRLRRASPFAFVLKPRERLEAWRKTVPVRMATG